MEKENFDAAHEAVLSKWKRDKERAELIAEKGAESLKRGIAGFLKNPNTRSNIATDMKNATRNHSKYVTESGFNTYDDGEVITGFEPLPWEK